MLYQFDVYSIGIFGGGTVLSALDYSLDEIFNWSTRPGDYEFSLEKLHNVTSSNGVLDFDYTAGGTRVWHQFSV